MEQGFTGAGCCGLNAGMAAISLGDDSGYDCVMIPAPSNEGPMAMIKDRYHLSGFFYPFHFLKINSRSSQLQGFISKVLEIPSCCLTDTHLIATAQTGIITKPSGIPSRRNYLNIQAVNICGRAKGLGFNDAKMATVAGAVSATICCELEKTIIMLLFCTTKSDWNLYSEAGAFQDQVPLRCLRVQERGTCRSCRRFRQGVQADVYAIQHRLLLRLRPLGVRRLTSTTDLHRSILLGACVFTCSYPISKSWKLYACLEIHFLHENIYWMMTDKW